jgi:hypothetical protein
MKFESEFFIVVSDAATGYPMCGNGGQSLTDPPPRSGSTETYKRCDDSVGQRFLCCVDGVPKAFAFNAGEAVRFTERHMILLVDLDVEIIPFRRCSEQAAAAVDGSVAVGDRPPGYTGTIDDVKNRVETPPPAVPDAGEAAVGTHADGKRVDQGGDTGH